MVLVEESEEKANVFPYWQYARFQLDAMLEDECLSEFRFAKADIPRLAEVLRLPAKFTCSNGTTASATEGLCMMLRRFSYPCRYSDLIPRFGRSKPEICLIVNRVMRYIDEEHRHLLESFDQRWLQPDKLEEYAAAIYVKSSALRTCWGFVDGTVRAVCRPGENQRVIYNGHKRVHAMKYQSVVAANGLIANLFGPVGKYV